MMKGRPWSLPFILPAGTRNFMSFLTWYLLKPLLGHGTANLNTRVQWIGLWQTINFSYMTATHEHTYSHTRHVKIVRISVYNGWMVGGNFSQICKKKKKNSDNLICVVNLNTVFYGMIQIIFFSHKTLYLGIHIPWICFFIFVLQPK
jgi:hypothetical protein